jgi:hypothetical protein
VDASSEKAMERATRHLASYCWRLESVEKGSVETAAADFMDQEEGLKSFWREKQKVLPPNSLVNQNWARWIDQARRETMNKTFCTTMTI